MTSGLKDYTDKHYTPDSVARYISHHFAPTGRILEPCKGGGAFLCSLPKQTEWCEIEEGRDFFDMSGEFDWIITNPPYSTLTDWMKHGFLLSDNVVYFIPLSKLFSSAPRLRLVSEYGGIKEIIIFGPGRSVGIPLGFPMGAVHFQRYYEGDTKIIHFKGK